VISLNDKVIIAFSDTHGNHRRLQVPEDADIVICAAEDLPDDIDILVTHWPPYGILDNDLGSLNILNFVLKAKPMWHLFGHIHETEGQQFQLAAPFGNIFPFLTLFLGFCRISAEGLVIFAEKLSIWQNSSIKSLVTKRVVYSVSPPLTK
jgi:hypothetical protein